MNQIVLVKIYSYSIGSSGTSFRKKKKKKKEISYEITTQKCKHEHTMRSIPGPLQPRQLGMYNTSPWISEEGYDLRPTSVLDMTLSRLMLRLRFLEKLLLPVPLWSGVVVLIMVLFTNPSARAGYDTRSIF